jgi:hypothetical protein
MKNGTTGSVSKLRLRVVRPFKAFDDGQRRKWIVLAAGRDLPVNIPLDANARVPNIWKNPTCREMRRTLLESPDLFPILNGGIICTASSVDVRQDGNDHIVEVGFDDDAQQGIVNGGHTYAQLIHALHGDTTYSEGMELKAVLTKDAARDSDSALLDLASDDVRLAEKLARAREYTQVQLEFVSPISDSDLLTQIARARNLSQSVEDTAFANLAGKFDLMKEVLAKAPAPFGKQFVDRVVWKTNQEVPEDSREVSVKLLIHIQALMNNRTYPPATKVCNSVYTRSGLTIREFAEADGEDKGYYDALTRILPQLIRFYDHVYASLPEVDPAFPWADGKLDGGERKRRRPTAFTPFLGRECSSKVLTAFVWPVYAAFRTVLVGDAKGLHFKTDPMVLFDEMKTELAARIMAFHRDGAHGVATQIGKDKEIWLRLQDRVEREMDIRQRLAQRA